MPRDFFQPKKRKQSVFDIIPTKKSENEAKSKRKEAEKNIEVEQETVTVVEDSYQYQEISESRKFPPKIRIRRWPVVLIISIAVLAGLFYLGFKVLPRLEVKVAVRKYPAAFNETIDVSKNFNYSQINASSSPIKLPAELFSASGTLPMSFPASGKETISDKAKGRITIYNSYSSDSQGLVANTRFLAPDNKIFHLIKAVTVPGAKIQEGKIIPSSIEADVIADQAGPDYNIGPVAKFTIPGFKGSPKYEGFYAKSDQSMTGGYVGEAAVPTDKDLSDAKTKIRQTLEDSLKINILSQIPADFKIIDGSFKFEVLKETIDKKADQNGNFNIVLQAQLKIIAFKEKDLKDILIIKSLSQLAAGDYDAADTSIEYGVPRPDFNKGEMSFPVKGQIIFKRKIDLNELRRQISGKNDLALKTFFLNLPDLIEKAEFSFWPRYVKTAPNNVGKIKIILQ
ncbi:MAG: hypothetical protein WC475_00750 [Candidatus Paceibacterota bacterium]